MCSFFCFEITPEKLSEQQSHRLRHRFANSSAGIRSIEHNGGEGPGAHSQAEHLANFHGERRSHHADCLYGSMTSSDGQSWSLYPSCIVYGRKGGTKPLWIFWCHAERGVVGRELQSIQARTTVGSLFPDDTVTCVLQSNPKMWTMFVSSTKPTKI